MFTDSTEVVVFNTQTSCTFLELLICKHLLNINFYRHQWDCDPVRRCRETRCKAHTPFHSPYHLLVKAELRHTYPCKSLGSFPRDACTPHVAAPALFLSGSSRRDLRIDTPFLYHALTSFSKTWVWRTADCNRYTISYSRASPSILAWTHAGKC